MLSLATRTVARRVSAQQARAITTAAAKAPTAAQQAAPTNSASITTQAASIAQPAPVAATRNYAGKVTMPTRQFSTPASESMPGLSQSDARPSKLAAQRMADAKALAGF
ncbi:hypothetical protein IE81DRAFT_329539 [Ceraceosorus guamensis]|uniref:Uncharacterized protein n=1 Tax=Ceraceosorus guamensis TaxID=1522189 RepID=A0A316W0T0_9BASI|nr:hypothetical protein IE81DRAFT_329539 [Ceraceosorus guamensis]PWN43400.1 hypothetical protein IE81DRAFT_329539 [Ceraceosorus guamensis]